MLLPPLDAEKIIPAVEQTEQRETNKIRLNMSYDKLKSLVANVEAIETAMKIRLQGRNATQEVLNIGTDRPIGGNMDEPIRRLQELIDEYPGFTEAMRNAVIENIKASVLTAFYTPKFIVDAVANQIHATFRQNGLQMRSFLEPSAGIGGFLPVAMSDTYSSRCYRTM